MSDHHYEFNVKMACGGCSGAIERVLKKTEGTPSAHSLNLTQRKSDIELQLTKKTGVKELDISLETQLVKITAGPEQTLDSLREKIKKTGKEIQSEKQID